MSSVKKKQVKQSIKNELYKRQFGGRVCSNYPSSPLNDIIGMHCLSYNTFGHEIFCITPPGMLEIEHLKPYNEGGGNTLDNLHLMCANCHSLKSRIETQFRTIKLNYYMKNIPMIEKKKYKNITINFRKNFKLAIEKYIIEKKEEGYPINDKCLINISKIINN